MSSEEVGGKVVDGFLDFIDNLGAENATLKAELAGFKSAEAFAEHIANRTAELILKNLFERHRNEISIDGICKEFHVSRETIRRRIRAGLLPSPQLKRGKNWFPRHVIETADIKGIL